MRKCGLFDDDVDNRIRWHSLIELCALPNLIERVRVIGGLWRAVVDDDHGRNTPSILCFNSS